jgi:hypothetical protein
MGGGKGSTSTSTIDLPQELEQGAVGTLGAALQSAALPYSPNRGVTIAGFSPQQEAGFQNADAAASAFGLAAGGQDYMPQQETGAGGVRGYSTGALYDENVNRSMGAADRLSREQLLRNYGMIGNTILSGGTLGGVNLWGAPSSNAPTGGAPAPSSGGGGGGGGGGGASAPRSGNSGNGGPTRPQARPTSGGGGYTGLADMLNGGGAGTSGGTFQGGPISGTLNRVGAKPRSSAGGK